MKRYENHRTGTYRFIQYAMFFPHYFHGHRNAARFDFDYTITNYGKVHILLFVSMHVRI